MLKSLLLLESMELLLVEDAKWLFYVIWLFVQNKLDLDFLNSGLGWSLGSEEPKGIYFINWRLARIAGKVNAMRYVLTSDLINAQRAYELGIVSEVYKTE